MSKFFDIDEGLEYKYKILVYPNITYKRDLEKDSYIVVLKNIIEVMNTVRNDIYWTLLLPDITPSLNNFENVNILIYNLPSYPNAMRTHFNFYELSKLIDWPCNDYDIVYSHLPEHTLQLSNFFHNNTNIIPKIIGYCHWFEVDENTAYDKRMLMHNIAGVLEMEEMGVNSLWLKNHILDKVKDIYSENILNRLGNIIQPHYLGVDEIDIDDPLQKTRAKSIIFNHRPNEYTGFHWFIETMDSIWKDRQDFTVYFTLADVDKPWAQRVKMNSRQEYMNFLKSMYIGVGTFEKYSAWSIAATDGMSHGVPYVLPHKLVYPEMLNKEYPLFYNNREHFKILIVQLLNSKKLRDEAHSWIKSNIQNFTWQNRVTKWFNDWDIFNFKTPSKTETYDKIVNFIHNKKSVDKKDILEYLGWGIRIPFTPYRHLLRETPNIKLTKDRYEWIT